MTDEACPLQYSVQHDARRILNFVASRAPQPSRDRLSESRCATSMVAFRRAAWPTRLVIQRAKLLMIGGSFKTRKRVGWRLPPLGAFTAASRISSRFRPRSDLVESGGSSAG